MRHSSKNTVHATDKTPAARIAGLQCLKSIIHGNVDAQSALNSLFKHNPHISSQDKGLCTDLVYGSLRMRIRLQWIVQQFLAKPEQLPKECLEILLLATYEILFLDKVPHYASVDWAVSLTKQSFNQKLASLVNAVLRNICRLEQAPLEESYYKAINNPAIVLSIFYALPQWIIDLWIQDYGYDNTLMLAKRQLLRPLPSIRLNAHLNQWQATRTTLMQESTCLPVGFSGLVFAEAHMTDAIKQLVTAHVLDNNSEQQTTKEETTFQQAPLQDAVLQAASQDTALRAASQDTALRASLQYAALQASWQSADSQAILQACAPQNWHCSPQHPIWDACCGRGGKTLALMEQGLPVQLASDPNAKRLAGLGADAQALGITPPVTQKGSAISIAQEYSEKFGSILLDLPCSGLGTLVKRPDILLKRTLADCLNLVKIQQDILEATSASLISGGTLVVITCTMHKAENQRNIEQFLHTHSNFTLKEQWTTGCPSPDITPLPLLDFAAPHTSAQQNTPHCLGTESFFAAVLQKK